jgi:hypothetical protein
MIGILLSATSFIVCYRLSRSSLAKGVCVMLAIGYLYGIARANISSPFIHFWFDFALLGLYAAQLWRRNVLGDACRNLMLQQWVFLLMLWPAILTLMPAEPLPITLVGLRTNAFFIPLVLIGARLTEGDLKDIGYWLIWLNLLALAFGVAEYILGVTALFPQNAKTYTIYASTDVGEERFHRIPACFSVAHAYGGTMLMSIPFVFGYWMQPGLSAARKLLALSGLLAALFGIMLSATRINFIGVVVALLVANTTVRLRASQRVAFILVLIVVGVVVAQNSRLQRFTTLKQTDYVKSRFHESINNTFWDLLKRYPMGNGLASGGTSIPFFLQSLAKNNTPMENEYARILMEQGVIGLALTLLFLLWYATRGTPLPGLAIRQSVAWRGGRKIARACSLFLLGTGLIGIGIFVSVPQAVLLFLCIGWVAAGAPWVPVRSSDDAVRSTRPAAFLWPRRATAGLV